MKIPKMDPAVKAKLEAALPKPGVTLRPMFGNVAGFVNGNMFCGVLGAAVFVRVSGKEREEVERGGGKPFEPMPGRPMKDYVEIPTEWVNDANSLKKWLSKAHEHTGAMPPKEKKGAKPAPRKARK